MDMWALNKIRIILVVILKRLFSMISTENHSLEVLFLKLNVGYVFFFIL